MAGQACVVTCGSINVDITAFCDHLPRPGESVAGHRYSITLGGKGANQATAVARLGMRSIFVGRTGNDDFGTFARDHLRGLGVEVDHLAADRRASTGVAVIDVDGQAENAIVVVGGANMAANETDIAGATEALREARVLLLQLEIPLAVGLAAAAVTRERGGLVILDPAPAPAGGLGEEALAAADIVTPNETETDALVGILPTSAAQAAAAAGRLVAGGAKTVIIKMGARGVFFRGDDGDGFVPPFPVKALNSVGAGDCFNGGLAVALARGDRLAEAVRFAAACGALATTGPGGAAAAPTAAAVAELMAAAPPPGR